MSVKGEYNDKPAGDEAGDYLAEYRCFFEKLSSTNADDQALKVLTSSVTEEALPGEIFSYAMQYLDLKECPDSLVTPLCRAVLDGSVKACMNDPLCLKTNKDRRTYQSMRVMSNVVKQVHIACQERLDNALAASLPPPKALPFVSIASSRNGVRRMEDRHVVIDNLNYLCDIESTKPSGFYAIYDGHCGPLAAVYSAAHLHMLFAKHPSYLQNPKAALREAFVMTDVQFNNDKLTGGSTATVCYLQEKNLLVGWVGDSRAILVKNGAILPLINSHKPNRRDERERIHLMGGYVSQHGTNIHRVNDILSISRAIGDAPLKPCVTSEPEFLDVTLDSNEDFAVIASDGLWDFVSDHAITEEVYRYIVEKPDDLKRVAERLVQVAKNNSSCDNISVLVVLLKDPSKIAEQARHIKEIYSVNMDSSFDDSAYNPQANMFHVNPSEMGFVKEGHMFDLAEGIKHQNGNGDLLAGHDSPYLGEKFTNGSNGCQPMDDEDLGPETDVDAVDDGLQHLSPSMEAARALVQGLVQHPDCFDEEVEMQAMEEERLRPAREDTPTPPIDAGSEIRADVADNVAESGGEDSEDEWNYIKGERKDNEDAPDPEIIGVQSKEDEDSDDAMNTQLNPEAPPFVPVSPTRSTPQNADPLAAIKREDIVSQSPQRPVPMDDIDVPEPNDFEAEASARLSDLGDVEKEYLNGHSNDSALSSQENLKEALHGNEKEMENYKDECSIDQQFAISHSSDSVDPSEFDRVQKDTMDFCDIRVNYLSQDNQNDEGIDEERFEQLKNKENDPMNMSFYQEKDEDACEIGRNPFDLNAVQYLPNDSDEEFENNQPQPDNSIPTLQIGETDATIEDFSKEIREYGASESPLIVEKGDTELPERSDEILSPVSDNVSQLTEPSETVEQQNFNIPAEGEFDSGLSTDIAHSVPSPLEIDDFCQIPQSQDKFSLPSDNECFMPPKTDFSEEISQKLSEPLNEFADHIDPPHFATEPHFDEPINVEKEISVPEMHTQFSESQKSPFFESQSPVPEMQPEISENKSSAFEDFGAMDDHSINSQKIDDMFGFSQPANLETKEPIFTMDQQVDECQFERKTQEPVSQIIETNVVESINHDFGINEFANDLLKSSLTKEQDLPHEFSNEKNNFYDNFSQNNQFEDIQNDICSLNQNQEVIENTSQLIDNQFDISNETLLNQNNDFEMPVSADNRFEMPLETEKTVIEEDKTGIMEFMPEPTPVSNDNTAHIPEVEPVSQVTEEPIVEAEISKFESIPVEKNLDVDHSESQNSTEVAMPAVAAAAVATAAAITVAAVAAAEDKKPAAKGKPTPITKKTPAKTAVAPTKTATSPTKAAVSPTKTAAPKVGAAAAPKKPTTINVKPATAASPKAPIAKPKTSLSAASPTKPLAAKAATTTAAAAKPRPAPTSTKTPVTEKKPLVNGEVKREPIRRPTTTTAAPKAPVPPKPASATTTTKTSTTTTTNVTRSVPAARPATAPVKTTTTTAVRSTATKPATTAAAKPRPTPAPATRAPSGRTSIAPKAPITEKVIKDTTNKQISASRPTPAPRTGLSTKVAETKTATKTTTKTTTTTRTSVTAPLKKTTTTTTKTAVTKTSKPGIKAVSKTIAVENQNDAIAKSPKEDLLMQETCVNGTSLISDIPSKEELVQKLDDLNTCYSY